MIVRDYDSKNVLKDLIRVLERASSETCAFIEIRLELREIYELLTELHKIPNANEAERQAEREDAPSIDIVRCKECKHGEYREDFDDYECHSSGCGLVYDADFFCADGERSRR